MSLFAPSNLNPSPGQTVQPPLLPNQQPFGQARKAGNGTGGFLNPMMLYQQGVQAQAQGDRAGSNQYAQQLSRQMGMASMRQKLEELGLLAPAPEQPELKQRLQQTYQR